MSSVLAAWIGQSIETKKQADHWRMGVEIQGQILVAEATRRQEGTENCQKPRGSWMWDLGSRNQG